MTTRPTRRHAAFVALIGAAIACAASLSACAGASRSTGATGNNTLSPGDPDAAATLADQYARDMAELAELQANRQNGTATTSAADNASRSGVFVDRTPRSPTESPANPQATGNGAASTASDLASATSPSGTDLSSTAGTGAATRPADPSIEAMARQLAASLSQRAMTGTTPFEDLSRVAMLEGVAPGVLEGLGEDEASDSARLISLLAPSERAALRAARATARRLAAADAADPSITADALRAAAASLDQAQAVRIQRAELCTRVDGFARYETFASNTFLAGRSNPMIVYVELDRFRQTPVAEAVAATPAATTTPASVRAPDQARFVVSLTQSLNLYFAEGGLLVWRRPPQVVTDYSRDRVRDFYIIDTIELPSTLAAGSYSLKVMVRDEATGQQAEAIIPITLVADPTLAQGR
ncbi:MAG: hypothetical protein R3B68_10575 [Phycisphaerales bacterium]